MPTEETTTPPAAVSAPAANPQAAGLESARIAIETTSAKERLASIPLKDPKVLEPIEPSGIEQVTELDIGAEPVTEEAAAPPPESDERRERFTKAAQDAKRNRLKKQREREEQQRLRAERDTYAQQVAQERQQREAYAQRAAAYENMTEEQFLEMRGVTHQQIIERSLDEANADKPEVAVKRLAAQLEAERQARIERERRDAARQAREADERNSREFLDVAKRKDDYPMLSRLAKADPDLIVSKADRVARAYHAKTGAYPSFDQICKYLDDGYKAALEEEKPKTEPSRSGAPSAQPVAPATDRTAGKSQTLTSRTAERATLPKPFGQMTKEEQGAHLLAQWKRENGAGG